jgi:Xaa-Pro aminopeptidase
VGCSRTEISPDEYRVRACRVAGLVRERGLDGLVAWSRGGGTVDRFANVLYLTNYYNPWPAVLDFPELWTGQGNAGVLVTAEGERVLITNVPEEEWRGSYVHCEDFVDDPHIDRGLARALTRHGLEHARVGLVAEDSLALGLYRRLLEATPTVRWEPADDILAEVRRIKSPAEMNVIRRAVSVGDAVMEAMLSTVRPGATEADVHRAGIEAGLALGLAPYDAPGASGPAPGAFAPSSLPSWSERELAAGDLWRTDMYGIWHGYLFDVSRSTVAGEPSASQLEILEAATAIVEAVISAIAPGMPFAVAHAAGDEATRRHAAWVRRGEGKHDYPHYGHTIGLGWEGLWIHPAETSTFEPGMHVAVETTVGRSETGFAMFEQDLLVVDSGVELTSRCDPRPWLRGR